MIRIRSLRAPRPFAPARRARSDAAPHPARPTPLLLALLGALLALPALASAQITAAEYEERRERFMTGEGAPAVAVALGNAANRQAHLPFAYLTGLETTDALLLLVREEGTGAADVRATLFLDPADPRPARLDGTTFDPAAPPAALEVRPLEELDERLGARLASASGAAAGGTETAPTLAVIGSAEAGRGDGPPSSAQEALSRVLERHPGVELASGTPRVNEMRAVKSSAELELIRRAVEITEAAHHAILRTLRPGLREADIQALVDSVFAAEGADARPAFGHIVASGPNSTILHYRGGERVIGDGEHVKIDIGAAYHGYAADVTRTYPANGRFSPELSAIYQIVRDAQAAAEAVAVQGASRAEHSVVADSVLGHGLAGLGLIEAPNATYDCPRGPGDDRQCAQLRIYYFHSLGHGIGLHVHDPTTNELVPGTAISIEPGIYLRPGFLDSIPDTPRNRRMLEAIRPAWERFEGIGVRIEDNHLLTDLEEGLRWISRSPREIDEIEAAMAQGRAGG